MTKRNQGRCITFNSLINKNACLCLIFCSNPTCSSIREFIIAHSEQSNCKALILLYPYNCTIVRTMASSFLPQLCVSYVIIMQRLHSERKITPIKNLQMCPLHISRKKGNKAGDTKGKKMSNSSRVSVQGVESLWGDCRTQVFSGRLGVKVVDLCYFALTEDFSL